MEEVTSKENKCKILSDLWLNYRQDEEFADFIEYNDIGLPLAYMIDSGIAKPTELAENFIEETFALLLAALDLEDIGFESLDEILDQSAENQE